MAQFNFQEYRKMMQSREESQERTGDSSPRTSVGFFSLKDDNDQAVVRFMFDSVDELDVVSLHRVSIGGRMRSVSCFRNPMQPVDACPICASDKVPQQKIFIPLVEYSRDEKGEVVAEPKIWERPASYGNVLNSRVEAYGPLSESVFKVIRHGAAGERGTTYSVNYCKPEIYRPDIYVKDGSAFDGFKVVGRIVLDLTKEEAIDVLNGNVPERLNRSRNTGNREETRSYTEPTPKPASRSYAPQETYSAPAREEVSYAEPVDAPKPRFNPAPAPTTSVPTRPKRYYN